MKTRYGYISNSSSTSFLIVYDEISSFDQFKKDKGYESLVIRLEKNALESEITEFFNDWISNYVYNYSTVFFCKKYPHGYFKQYPWRRHYYPAIGSIVYILKKFNVENETLNFTKNMLGLIESKADEMVKKNLFDEDEIVENFRDMIDMLTLQVINAIVTKWKNVSLFEISDNTDYEYYLEQEFFPRVIANDNEQYAGMEINHH